MVPVTLVLVTSASFVGLEKESLREKCTPCLVGDLWFVVRILPNVIIQLSTVLSA